MNKQSTMDKENLLILYQTPKIESDNILESEVKPSFSLFPNMPLFKYGFYYYIHQTKNKMEMFEKPEFKTKDLHKIINAYEDTVPQEEFIKQFKNDQIKPTDDINSLSVKYFQSDRIISRAFYKLWELLMMFPLIKDNTKSFTSIHIAEAPGSFVQSAIYYRHKFFSKDQTDSDRYIATSIEPQKKPGEYIPTFNSDLTNYKQFNQWSYKNSDLTKPDIIKKFISDNQDIKADLITADGGFNWKDENYQEQEAYVLLLSEIYCALKTQKQGGSFVIKFFETFTELTVKMIEILKRYYSIVYITKPLLSRPSNSERYIVCINFSKADSNLEKLFEIITESNSKSNKFLVDIFPDYQIPKSLDMVIKLSATQMSNEQHKQINEMISYINDGNYFGDAYRKYLMRRRHANDFWISVFYPGINQTGKMLANDITNARNLINTLIRKNLVIMKKTLDELNSKLEMSEYKFKTIRTDKTIKPTKFSESVSDSDTVSETETETDSETVSESEVKTKTKSKPKPKSKTKSK